MTFPKLLKESVLLYIYYVKQLH